MERTATETAPPSAWRIVMWCAIGIVILLWRSGWGSFPDAEFLATRVVPSLPSLPRMDPLFQYLYSSPIGAWTARLVGATSVGWFDVVHLVAFAAFVVATAVLVVRRWGLNAGALVGAAFVGSQAGVVCLFWVGSYDVFMVGLSSLVVVVHDRRVQALLGFALAFTAFEQSVIVLVLLLLLSFVDIVEDRWRFVATAAGLVMGRIVLGLWLAANDVHHGRLEFLRHFGVQHFLDQFWTGLPWLLLTGLGASIVAVVFALRAEGARAQLMFVAVLIVALVPVALSEDQTRVFALLTWPPVLALMVRFASRADGRAVRTVSLATLGASVVIPGVVVWTGHARLAAHHALRTLRR